MKTLTIVLPVLGFLAFLGGQAGYHMRSQPVCETVCVTDCEPAGSPGAFSAYVSEQDYMLGMSYGLAVAFTIYAALIGFQSRRIGVKGVFGGSALAACVYGAGCFLLGCCGSPLLPVYLTLFGSSLLGFAKPLILLLTACSVAVGFIWLRRRVRDSAEGCCRKEIHAA